MKVAIASDHRGVEYRRRIAQELTRLGCEVIDMGPDGETSVDYPDYARLVALAVTDGRADRGVLVCGTGIGMSLAANKVRGIRAAVAHDAFTAERSTRHNNANILCLGQEVVAPDALADVIRAWLTATFEGGRHGRRVDKIMSFEAEPRTVG